MSCRLTTSARASLTIAWPAGLNALSRRADKDPSSSELRRSIWGGRDDAVDDRGFFARGVRLYDGVAHEDGFEGMLTNSGRRAGRHAPMMPIEFSSSVQNSVSAVKSANV